MTAPLVHFEEEILYETTYRSACGVSSDKHSYTTRDEEVTCPKCLKALGYEVPEVEEAAELRRAA